MITCLSVRTPCPASSEEEVSICVCVCACKYKREMWGKLQFFFNLPSKSLKIHEYMLCTQLEKVKVTTFADLTFDSFPKLRI